MPYYTVQWKETVTLIRSAIIKAESNDVAIDLVKCGDAPKTNGYTNDVEITDCHSFKASLVKD